MGQPQDNSELSRRELLRKGIVAGAGMIAVGALTQKSWAFSKFSRAKQKHLVIINLYGGNDILNTFIPVKLQLYYQVRANLAIPEESALTLKDRSDYKLHPSLLNLRSLFNQGKVAFVQRVGFPNMAPTHLENQDVYSLGRTDAAADARVGWIAKYAELYAGDSIGAVSVGVNSQLDFEGGAAKKTASFESLMRSDPSRVELTKYDSQSGVPQYPNTILGKRLQNAARVLSSPSPASVVYTGLGGFDTHGSQGKLTGTHPELLGQVDEALGVFCQDLNRIGIWEDVAIVLISEFGRATDENVCWGTDHGQGGGMILIGGGVKGGVYGDPLTEADLTNKVGFVPMLPVAIDFRTVYYEICSKHLGISAADLQTLFPQQKDFSQSSLGLLS